MWWATQGVHPGVVLDLVLALDAGFGPESAHDSGAVHHALDHTSAVDPRPYKDKDNIQIEYYDSQRSSYPVQSIPSSVFGQEPLLLLLPLLPLQGRVDIAEAETPPSSDSDDPSKSHE